MPPRKKQAAWLTREELIAKVDEEMKMASSEVVANLVIEKQKQVGMVRPHPDAKDCEQYLCWTSASSASAATSAAAAPAPASAAPTAPAPASAAASASAAPAPDPDGILSADVREVRELPADTQESQ